MNRAFSANVFNGTILGRCPRLSRESCAFGAEHIAIKKSPLLVPATQVRAAALAIGEQSDQRTLHPVAEK